MLTIKWEELHHQIYPDTVLKLMQEQLLVQNTKDGEEQKDLDNINWDTCAFEVIYFKETRTSTNSKDVERLIKEFSAVFKRRCPGCLLRRGSNTKSP